MRLAIFSSLMLTVLAAATGCGASGATHQPATPTATAAATANDPSWTPPDQMKLTIGEGKSTHASSDLTNTMPTPNRRTIVSGALHAAR